MGLRLPMGPLKAMGKLVQATLAPETAVVSGGAGADRALSPTPVGSAAMITPATSRRLTEGPRVLPGTVPAYWARLPC